LNGDDVQDNKPVLEGCEILLENIRKLQSLLTVLKNQEQYNQSGRPGSLSEIALEAEFSTSEYILSRIPIRAKEFFSWRFATTRNSDMGLVPNVGRVSDIICVIYSCEMPFVLRICAWSRCKFIGHSKIQRFNFDEAVVGSSVVLQKRKKQSTKDSHFSVLDKYGRRVYTTLKKTRQFTLV
jgi:hypothetical protein